MNGKQPTNRGIMKAYQIAVGDKLDGKTVTSVCKENKIHVNIKTEGQRRGILCHHSKDLDDVETDRPISGEGFKI